VETFSRRYRFVLDTAVLLGAAVLLDTALLLGAADYDFDGFALRRGGASA
jgi:hypothetical protein